MDFRINMKKFIKWFELNWGWLFINARKHDQWIEHLKKKYNDKK